jgi:muramoyltetrapeptide carboxypeptidase
MHSCQLPPALQPGDRLGVIAPSGALREPAALDQGLAIWRERGYKVDLLPGYDGRWGYLAGKDSERRQQLQGALADRHYRGILCARGGWGAARLLEDWPLPISEPKWLIGFSDITSLLWGLSHHGIAGLHGPVLTTLGQEPDWSVQRLFDCVEGRALSALSGTGWGGGPATGLLLPANLTVATHLLGTPVQPNFAGVILALEDVGEAPYRLDRMLTQWRTSGALSRVAGIALGRFSQCEPPEGYDSLSVAAVLRDRLGDLGIPIVSDLPFGHDGENGVLPVGVEARLDADRGTLNIL